MPCFLRDSSLRSEQQPAPSALQAVTPPCLGRGAFGDGIIVTS